MYLAQRKVSTISDEEFIGFVEEKVRQSWIISNNPYTNWFKRGDLTTTDLQRLMIELANYENFLYIAQCLKSMYFPISNTPIFYLDFLNKKLENKIIFNNNFQKKCQIFDFYNFQYELILNAAETFGLDHQDLQPTKALKSSIEFGKKGIISLIGNKNRWVSAGASFANAIGSSYWHPLYKGIELFNEQEKKQISSSLFLVKKNHSESQYSATKQEIEHLLTVEEFNRQHFIIGVEYFLKEFTEFWEGLCSDYLVRAEKPVVKCK
jgi:hypothetical protein